MYDVLSCFQEFYFAIFFHMQLLLSIAQNVKVISKTRYETISVQFSLICMAKNCVTDLLCLNVVYDALYIAVPPIPLQDGDDL